jgi:hypothetical protein
MELNWVFLQKDFCFVKQRHWPRMKGTLSFLANSYYLSFTILTRLSLLMFSPLSLPKKLAKKFFYESFIFIFFSPKKKSIFS